MKKKYLEKISCETIRVLKDVNIDKLFQKREKLKIAVTGLNRSGKTVFITSFINQLISGKRLDRVKNKNDNEFIAKLLPFQDGDIKEFDYKSILDGARSENPKWPKSTATVTKANLLLEIKSKSSFFPNKLLEIEIIDYPGEWLFDLQMFNKSFEDWSEEMFVDIRSSSKKDFAKDWLNELNKHDIYGFNDGSSDKGIADKYRNYLRTIQNMGFSIIQPGRNVQSGNITDSSIMLFTPLPKPKHIIPHEDSIYSRFQKRHQRYLVEIVTPLAENYFLQFDRQIILIDVLKSLQNGYNSFIDMTQAVKRVIEIYGYGNQSFLKNMVEKKIDKVLFGATKADYIVENQHQNYQKLLNTIIEDATKELDIKGIDTKSIVFTSVKSTEDIKKDYQNRELDCLKGKVIGSEAQTIECSSGIPESYPEKANWKEGMYNFPNFAPISFPDRDIDAIPHINMDLIIDYLIGDKL